MGELPDGSCVGLVKSCYGSLGIEKLATDGSYQWGAGIAPAGGEPVRSGWIQALSNGDCFAVGNYGNVVLELLDGSGVVEWLDFIDASFVASTVAVCSDGGFIIGGGSGVLKTDSTGDFIQ